MLLALTGSSKNNSISTTTLVTLTKAEKATVVSYKTEPEISGRIAFLGKRFLNTVANKIAGQFFANIEKQILEAERKKQKAKKIKKTKKLVKSKKKKAKKKELKKKSKRLKSKK